MVTQSCFAEDSPCQGEPNSYTTLLGTLAWLVHENFVLEVFAVVSAKVAPFPHFPRPLEQLDLSERRV